MTHDAPILPLCSSCASSIGGACGGPDCEWRPAAAGEPCGAADCDSRTFDVGSGT